MENSAEFFGQSDDRYTSVFSGCCLFIVLTSIIDAALVLMYPETILGLESNPLCLALMQLEPQYFSIFLVWKFVGTCVVIATLCRLFVRRRAIAMVVVWSVSAFQLGLMLYQCCVWNHA